MDTCSPDSVSKVTWDFHFFTLNKFLWICAGLESSRCHYPSFGCDCKAPSIHSYQKSKSYLALPLSTSHDCIVLKFGLVHCRGVILNNWAAFFFSSDSSTHALTYVWSWSVWPWCQRVILLYLVVDGEPRIQKVMSYWVSIYMHIIVRKRDWSNSVILDLELNNRLFKKYYPTLRSWTVCKSSSVTAIFQHWYALLKSLLIFSFECLLSLCGHQFWSPSLYYCACVDIYGKCQKNFNRYVLAHGARY